MNPIETQLRELRLMGMHQCFTALSQNRQWAELSLNEGLELLLQAEEEERHHRRFKRLMHNAAFRYQASISELGIDPQRGVDKQLIQQLAKGDFLDQGESVLITGATGCGKSFLASALGHHACTLGYKVAYYNLQKLLHKIQLARIEGTHYKFLEKTAKTDLLILDDFGLIAMDKTQQTDLLEIIEDRHGRKATVIASQLPVASWYEVIAEQTIADAILDRLVHTSYRIELKGDSLRKKR